MSADSPRHEDALYVAPAVEVYLSKSAETQASIEGAQKYFAFAVCCTGLLVRQGKPCC